MIKNILEKEIEYEKTIKSHLDKRSFYNNNLFFFAKEVLGYERLSEKIHKRWAKSMEDESIKRRLRLKPRGTYKTSLYTIAYPVWKLLKNNNLRISICSGNLENAIDSSQTIKRNFIYNKKLIDLYGEFYDKKLPWTQSAFSIKGRKDYNKKENSITAVGFGTQMTGKHFDLIIADDIVNNDDRESQTIRKKKQRWFEDLISILEPDGEVLIVGTRWHYDDFYNYIINELNPKLMDKEKYDLEIECAINENGMANFPDLLPLEKLEILKLEKGLVEFNSQYMNSPIAVGTQIFFETDLKFYIEEDIEKDSLAIAYLDPSLGKNYESDYSALIIGIPEKDDVLNIVDAVIVRILPDLLIELIQYNCRKYNIKILGIESNSFQEYLVDEIEKKLKPQNIKIEKVKNFTNKEVRIQSIQPLIKNGYIKFNPGINTIYPILKEQLLLYPLAKNDDGPDALEGLYSLFKKITERPGVLHFEDITPDLSQNLKNSRIW
jgi:predicted phage terminase large subunit-like protein